MSLAVDDVKRIKELKDEGFSDCAIERYMNGVSRSVARVTLGSQPGSVLVDPLKLSVRERRDYLNRMAIPRSPAP